MKERPTKRMISITSMSTRLRGAGRPRRSSQEYTGLTRRLKTTAKKMGLRTGAPRRIPASTMTVVARNSITRKKEGWRRVLVMASVILLLSLGGLFVDSFMI
jgi:hypothetical protein